MIDLRGLSRVSEDLEVSRESLARYLAEIPVQRATFALIESKLAEPAGSKGSRDALPG